MSERLFRLIETRATLPDGRVINANYSNPRGYTKAEYDKIDADLVTAFGTNGSSTKGTYLDR